MGEVNVSATESRFFIEHGVVHDRKTGKHLRGVVFEWENDSPENLLAVLCELENEAFSWKHTARAFDARAEQAEAALSVAQKDAAFAPYRVQEWLHQEYDVLAPVQEIERAMQTPCAAVEVMPPSDPVELIAHGGAGEGEENGQV